MTPTSLGTSRGDNLRPSGPGLGWQQHLGTLAGLVDAEGFDAGKAWCEDHADAIGGASAYAFSKQVINAWVASKAGAYLAKGVRLDCTNPGPTDTPMMPFFHKSYGKAIIDAAVGPSPGTRPPRNRPGRSCS